MGHASMTQSPIEAGKTVGGGRTCYRP